MEAIRFTNTSVDEIGIDDSSRYPSNEFQEDDPSRQYQVDSNVSYYIIPHGRSLTEITQGNHVPELIAPNEPEIPHTEDTKSPLDLINTEGTHEQNVQNDQMIIQPTDTPSGNNTEGSESITKPLVPDVTQSYISNQASTSSHPSPQDRWSRDQHIQLVNIIGNPGKGMLTRSMAAKLTAASASECLFADFLSKIEPKDDIIFGLTSYKHCKQFEKLMTKKFEMSMMGELTYFLGLQIKQDDKGISICQEQYTRNLLKKYEVSDSSSVKTPMVSPYDLGYQSNPKDSHLIAVKRILKYLKGTPTIGLYYLKCSGFDLKGYLNSDYAGCKIYRKSTSGACQILGGKLMKSQLSDYDIHYKIVPIVCENTSAIAISSNLVLHSRTKHISIRYHFIRDHILKEDIKLHIIPTKYQLADIFTKPIDEPTFTKLKAELGMLNID
ncbi:retrovirus-related pol polyprotein from transposon TNT 1-94 [Tanacetum coccineum]